MDDGLRSAATRDQLGADLHRGGIVSAAGVGDILGCDRVGADDCGPVVVLYNGRRLCHMDWSRIYRDVDCLGGAGFLAELNRGPCAEDS